MANPMNTLLRITRYEGRLVYPANKPGSSGLTIRIVVWIKALMTRPNAYSIVFCACSEAESLFNSDWLYTPATELTKTCASRTAYVEYGYEVPTSGRYWVVMRPHSYQVCQWNVYRAFLETDLDYNRDPLYGRYFTSQCCYHDEGCDENDARSRQSNSSRVSKFIRHEYLHHNSHQHLNITLKNGILQCCWSTHTATPNSRIHISSPQILPSEQQPTKLKYSFLAPVCEEQAQYPLSASLLRISPPLHYIPSVQSTHPANLTSATKSAGSKVYMRDPTLLTAAEISLSIVAARVKPREPVWGTRIWWLDQRMRMCIFLQSARTSWWCRFRLAIFSYR